MKNKFENVTSATTPFFSYLYCNSKIVVYYVNVKMGMTLLLKVTVINALHAVNCVTTLMN